jgi:metal-responsive CopG/Arc/MetJ family transcriptional regulator
VRRMRVTIEIRNDQRARLLKLAAERGERGFSGLIQEAVDRYLAEIELRDQSVEDSIAMIGSLDADAAEGLRERVASVRKYWR